MSYIIGIDVGGTNTNACLLPVEHDSKQRFGYVVETVKIPTDHDHLVFSTGQALKKSVNTCRTMDSTDWKSI